MRNDNERLEIKLNMKKKLKEYFSWKMRKEGGREIEEMNNK